ncbi:MAG: methylenetetrahydrofolate reductase [NAD(P)H] [Nitrospirae bacterium]|nr:methylenetetrahydrofolate reductase [NAD(P)H] [Candidatus Troglogloeales bacterium]MBI3599009.1 methylenetetrahydrofolate reductase [NAD(P)H] [Candidatus Troglogloeales bacterium]
MKISSILKQDKPVFSFEFFPPRTPEGVVHLFETIAHLKPLSPSFVSVTYGAGGSTRELTVDLVSRIKNELGIEAMAHLTCVESGRDEIDKVLYQLDTAGIENLLALRGDPPNGDGSFVIPPDGFSYASDLTRHIRKKFSFSLGGAGHPEGHIECGTATAGRDLKKDLEHLKIKVDEGVDFIITQLFFENKYFFDFVERAKQAGIHIPIIPGIMPITNVNQVKRFTKMCGASLPKALLSELESVEEDSEAVTQIGVCHATEQCRNLLKQSAPGIHFYTLNKSLATKAILESLSDFRR